jgi:Ca2+-binding RTX toxin-like protein
MMIESLESRRLLSTSINITAGTLTLTGTLQTAGSLNDVATLTSRGTLVVHGTDNAETISVTREGGQVHVWRRAAAGGSVVVDVAFSAASVKRILVEAGRGSDRVGLSADLNERATLAGGGGNDILQGNIGDTLIGGTGNDLLYVQVPDRVDLAASALADPQKLVLIASPQSVLSGGDGDDTLVTRLGDRVIGGKGSDTVILHDPNFLDSRLVPADVEAGFGDFAEGVEFFEFSDANSAAR